MGNLSSKMSTHLVSVTCGPSPWKMLRTVGEMFTSTAASDMMSDISRALSLSKVSTTPSYEAETTTCGSDIDDEDYRIESVTWVASKAALIAISGVDNSGKHTFSLAFRAALSKRDARPSVSIGFESAVKGVVGAVFGMSVDYIDKWKADVSTPPDINQPMRVVLQHVRELERFRPSLWIKKALTPYDERVEYTEEAPASPCGSAIIHFDDVLEDATEDLECGPSNGKSTMSDHNPVTETSHMCPFWWVASDIRNERELEAIQNRKGLLILLGRESGRGIAPPGHICSESLQSATQWFLAHTKGNIVRVESLILDGAPELAKHFHYFVRNDGSLEDLRRSAARLASVVAIDSSSEAVHQRYLEE
jgi:hypothetical protein